MTTTQTSALVTCPPSAVADMIVPWSDVQKGDLVLHYGSLAVVDDIDAFYEHEGRRSFRIDGAWHYHRPGDLTAVRRYDLSEEQDR